jgi:hypothetical protein
MAGAPSPLPFPRHPGRTAIPVTTSAGADRDTVYVGPRRLAAMGVVPGGIFQHRAAAANWGGVVDGLVVFRKEHPVTRIDE